jgi:hypothetical protein
MLFFQEHWSPFHVANSVVTILDFIPLIHYLKKYRFSIPQGKLFLFLFRK